MIQTSTRLPPDFNWTTTGLHEDVRLTADVAADDTDFNQTSPGLQPDYNRTP